MKIARLQVPGAGLKHKYESVLLINWLPHQWFLNSTNYQNVYCL